MRFAAKGLAILSTWLMACSLRTDVSSQSKNCGSVYANSFSSWPLPRPLPNPSGLALADVNADGWTDAVLASGNDVAKVTGPVAVLFNPQSEREPWLSARQDHYFRVAVADLNHDAFMDVVATLYPPEANGGMPCSSSTVVAHVYISDDSGLPLEPTQRISVDGCVVGSDAAFADVDGDGWVDLAVSVMDLIQRNALPQLVYLNRAGELDLQSPWRSETTVPVASSVALGDLDSDGLMDLIVGSMAPLWATVFFGALDATGRPALHPIGQSYRFGDAAVLALDVDLFADKTHGVRALTVFSNHLCGVDDCRAPLARFDSQLDVATWQTPESAMWTSGEVADLDGDGYSDVVAGSWRGGRSQPEAGPLLVFCGTDVGWSRSGAWLGKPHVHSTFDLAVADLDNSGLLTQRFIWSGERSATPVSVLTLPEPRVERVRQVRKNGQTLDAHDYTWVPGTSWVGFTPQLESPDSVEIEYITTTSPDVALTDLMDSNTLPVLLHR